MESIQGRETSAIYMYMCVYVSQSPIHTIFSSISHSDFGKWILKVFRASWRLLEKYLLPRSCSLHTYMYSLSIDFAFGTICFLLFDPLPFKSGSVLQWHKTRLGWSWKNGIFHHMPVSSVHVVGGQPSSCYCS